MSEALRDRVAIVTGAARNIGRAIALELASTGAAVVVGAKNSGKEAEEVVSAIEAAGDLNSLNDRGRVVLVGCA